MVSQLLYLLDHTLGVQALHRIQDTRVQRTSLGYGQLSVRHLLHQRMLERVRGFEGAQIRTIEEVGLLQLTDGGLQCLLIAVADRTPKRRGDIATDDGGGHQQARWFRWKRAESRGNR